MLNFTSKHFTTELASKFAHLGHATQALTTPVVIKVEIPYRLKKKKKKFNAKICQFQAVRPTGFILRFVT